VGEGAEQAHNTRGTRATMADVVPPALRLETVNLDCADAET
jgi:hypothetical protein